MSLVVEVDWGGGEGVVRRRDKLGLDWNQYWS